jgi:peptidylprolyl isomerase
VQWGDAARTTKQRKPLGTGPGQAPRPNSSARARASSSTACPTATAGRRRSAFADGFPAARDPQAGKAWLAHCYGAIGAGRDVAADSSNGTELYVVTGQSPRQLDRNITVVGRVVQGIELLSVLPRGTGRSVSTRSPNSAPRSRRSALLRTYRKTIALPLEAAAHRHRGFHPTGRSAPQPPRRVVQAARRATSTCATCRCRCVP